MRAVDTLTYKCKIGDHDHCEWKFVGASVGARTAQWMVCRCDCGHKMARVAHENVRR